MDNKLRRTRRIAILICAGTVVISGTLGYLRFFATFRFWLPQPIGSGPAGPAVPRQPFQKQWTSRPVVLLGIGDSVTAGFGADPGMSYFNRLQKNPPNEFDDMRGICLTAVIPHLSAYNLAVSGSDSIQHHDTQVAQLKAFPPEVLGIVVMTTGGNDLIHWYGRSKPREGAMYGATFDQAQPWIANYRTRLDDMLTKVTAAFPGGCHIFLANIYDPSDGIGNPTAAWLPPWNDLLKIHTAYNEAIKNIAANHANVHVVDIQKPFLGHGVYCVQWWRPHYHREDPTYWYYSNLEDPNNRGYDALRRIFLIEIANTLAPNADTRVR